MSRNPSQRPIRKHHTPRERKKLLRAYHRSQQTQPEFVARHGIGLSTLSKWLREERQIAQPEEAAGVLQEVVVSPSPESRVAMVEIVNPQGWTVRFSGTMEAKTVRRWLEALPC